MWTRSFMRTAFILLVTMTIISCSAEEEEDDLSLAEQLEGSYRLSGLIETAWAGVGRATVDVAGTEERVIPVDQIKFISHPNVFGEMTLESGNLLVVVTNEWSEAVLDLEASYEIEQTEFDKPGEGILYISHIIDGAKYFEGYGIVWDGNTLKLSHQHSITGILYIYVWSKQ